MYFCDWASVFQSLKWVDMVTLLQIYILIYSHVKVAETIVFPPIKFSLELHFLAILQNFFDVEANLVLEKEEATVSFCGF